MTEAELFRSLGVPLLVPCADCAEAGPAGPCFACEANDLYESIRDSRR